MELVTVTLTYSLYKRLCHYLVPAVTVMQRLCVAPLAGWAVGVCPRWAIFVHSLYATRLHCGDAAYDFILCDFFLSLPYQ